MKLWRYNCDKLQGLYACREPYTGLFTCWQKAITRLVGPDQQIKREVWENTRRIVISEGV